MKGFVNAVKLLKHILNAEDLFCSWITCEGIKDAYDTSFKLKLAILMPKQNNADPKKELKGC